jgi:hypothetical protein
MLKLSCPYDSLRCIMLKIWTEWVINCVIFQFLTMCNTIVGARAIMLRLWLRPKDAPPWGYGSGFSTLLYIEYIVSNSNMYDSALDSYPFIMATYLFCNKLRLCKQRKGTNVFQILNVLPTLLEKILHPLSIVFTGL